MFLNDLSSLKHIVYFIVLFTLLSNKSNAQIDSSSIVLCQIHYGGLSNDSDIFISVDTPSVQIVSTDSNIVTLLFNKKMLPYKEDRISNEKPLSHFIDSFYYKIDKNDFIPITYNDHDSIVYSSNKKIFGNDSKDLLEIVISEPYYEWGSKYKFQISMSLDGELFVQAMCEHNFQVKPSKYYISNNRYNDMPLIIFLSEDDSEFSSYVIIFRENTPAFNIKDD